MCLYFIPTGFYGLFQLLYNKCTDFQFVSNSRKPLEKVERARNVSARDRGRRFFARLPAFYDSSSIPGDEGPLMSPANLK